MPKVIRNAEGVPFSRWRPAAKFQYVWALHGIYAVGSMEREYVFDAERKWRFDFAWPSVKLAVEIEGFGWGHQAQQHIAADAEKQNAAVQQGWRVLRYTSRQLGSAQGVCDAVEQVCQVLCGVE